MNPVDKRVRYNRKGEYMNNMNNVNLKGYVVVKDKNGIDVGITNISEYLEGEPLDTWYNHDLAELVDYYKAVKVATELGGYAVPVISKDLKEELFNLIVSKYKGLVKDNNLNMDKELGEYIRVNFGYILDKINL